jgi:hypothetical protein
MRYSHLSVERFRTASKCLDRPAAADIAFCVAAYSLGMPDGAMAGTLDSEYLFRDPNPATPGVYFLARHDIEAHPCGHQGEPGILLQPVARQRGLFIGICPDGRYFVV